MEWAESTDTRWHTPAPEDIIEQTALVFGVTREEMVSTDRHRRVAKPRHVAMYLLSLPEGGGLCPRTIGTLLGNRDRGTAISAIQKTRACIEAKEDGLPQRIAAIWEGVRKCIDARAIVPPAPATPADMAPKSESATVIQLRRRVRRQGKKIVRLQQKYAILEGSVRTLERVIGKMLADAPQPAKTAAKKKKATKAA